MAPRHFWWLMRAEQDAKPERALSNEDKAAVLDALRGNPRGAIW